MSQEWYYVDAARAQQGPCSVKELRALWSQRTLNGETLVWRDGQDGWSAIDSIDELKQKLVQTNAKAAPPPVPPPVPPVVPLVSPSMTSKLKQPELQVEGHVEEKVEVARTVPVTKLKQATKAPSKESPKKKTNGK